MHMRKMEPRGCIRVTCITCDTFKFGAQSSISSGCISRCSVVVLPKSLTNLIPTDYRSTMSDRSDTTNSSESEAEMSEEISESEPAMSEESSKEEEDENDDVIPRQLSLNSSSPSEEIFLFNTRGRTRIAKKKPRLETKRSFAIKFSNVATKTKSVSRGGKSSVPPKKSFTLPEASIKIACLWHSVHTFSPLEFKCAWWS